MNLLLALLALPVPPGWTAGVLETHETSKAIYAAINGAADLYFAYGLESMQVREYATPKLRVEVEIYELGEALDALGVLRRERPRDGHPVGVGAEGWANKYLCVARLGRRYIRAKAYQGEMTAPACESLLPPILAGFESVPDPKELGLLPETGRVPNSVGYTRERFLGMSSLVRCLHADYEGGYRLFVMMRGEWDSLKTGWKSVPNQPVPMVRREIPYTGWVAVAKTNQGMIGALADDRDRVVARLVAVLPK